MARKKKVEPYVPPKPRWNMNKINELTDAIEYVLEVWDDIASSDRTAGEWLRFGEDPNANHDGFSHDFVDELDYWLMQIDNIRYHMQTAQYLARYFPTNKPITVDDIDDDIRAEMNRLFYSHFSTSDDIKTAVDYFNDYIVNKY